MILSQDAVVIRDRLIAFDTYPVRAAQLTQGFTSGSRVEDALKELDRAGLVRVEGDKIWYLGDANPQHIFPIDEADSSRKLCDWGRRTLRSMYMKIGVIAGVLLFIITLTTDLFSAEAVCTHVPKAWRATLEKCADYQGD